MIKDVYLFTNGTLIVFDESGKQLPELQGKITDEKKQQIAAQFMDGTRITFARWKKGFFELTREEFMAAEIQDDLFVLRFATNKTVEGYETSSPN